METVVLFADISGFTMISEACAAMGVRGNEELAFCINRYMEGMVKALGKYGGDIIKFVGDAMIVMWPRIGGNGADGTGEDDKVTVVRKAIQCALDIQNDMNNKKIMRNVTNLSVKIGIGFGECALLYVGGVFNRAEFFTVGDALTQALSSEENATAGGQIIVSGPAWSLVHRYFESQELSDDHSGKKFYKIQGMIQGIRTRADAVLLRNLIQTDNFSKIQSKLRACVPAAIMPYLELGYEQFGSETRRLTVMFASLGIDLSSAKSKEGMNKIQKIVTTVQQQVYRMEGSLNKLVMDDKGSTLICIWGLCPFSHEDDASRAILTAINIRRELLKIEKTWCNVGISTGEVFSGVVGTSGSRKEFSVLGDYVNLAARIMYWPKKYKQTGKIYVDLQTKKEADNFINFIYKDHCEFKGKSISLPIFEPIDPTEESFQCIKRVASYDTFLKLHSNPFLVDRNSEHKRKQAKQIGRETLVSKVFEDLQEFFEDQAEERRLPYLLGISGEIGSGKTLFARCLLEKFRKRKDLLKDASMGTDAQLILTSSLNAESEKKFLNIWRPVLQTMLYIISKRRKANIESTLAQLTNYFSIKEDEYDIVLDVFGMQQLKPDGEIVQLPLPAGDPLQFVKREVYNEEKVDIILDFLIDFIKIVLGEEEEGGNSSGDNNSSQEEDFGDTSRQDKSNDASVNSPFGPMAGSPILIILDTVYFMDEASWRLLELIKDECSRVAVIMLMQTDTNNSVKIHPEARQFYEETFGNSVNRGVFQVIDLPPFKLEDLQNLIQDVASKYQNSMGEEIHMMTHIEDLEHSIKNPEVCKQKAIDLKKQYKISESYFTKVNEQVIQLALSRCEGNPLVSLNFLFNLLSNDFLTQKGSVLEPTSKFLKCQQRSDWTTVPAAGISLKVNSALLDSFLKEMRAKPNKSDQETSVKGLMLLKCAAVIGDVFGSKTLQQISPLRHETHQQIIYILKTLEQRDLVEILDETDPKNAICRFRKSFLRESIYQIMLYRAQKMGIHQLVVQHIQDNPNSIDNDPEIEADKLLQHILLAEDLDSEDKIPQKSKQGLIVKKIANVLMKNPNAIVKKGKLTKEGNKPNRRVEHRLMIVKAKTLTWYHDQKELEQGKKPLGVIYMHAIYHCVPAKGLRSTDDFIIAACAWRKKDTEKEGKREFIFGAENQQQRDEWISCIEYLRTKATYDSFVSKYCNIAFPLRRQSEVYGEQKKDILSQLNQFSYKFKSQARFNSNNRSSYEQHDQTIGGTSRHQSQKRSTGRSMITQNMSGLQDGQQAQELAQKIKSLFKVAIVSYVNQVSQNASKSSHSRYETIRRIPEVVRRSSLMKRINHGLGADEEFQTKGLFQNHHEHSMSGILMDEPSPLVKYDKAITDLRRKSEMMRRGNKEDSQVVRFIEDLRSAETSPPERKQPDSNEGFSSENTAKQQQLLLAAKGILQQRKSSISNFTAKSQPQPTTLQSQFHTSNSDLSAPVPQNTSTADNIIVEGAATSDKQLKIEQNVKSRISVQIEMMNHLSKQRTMTFNQEDQEQVNAASAAGFQINPIEVQQLQQLKKKKKIIEHMEKIEEKEEYDLRKVSGANSNELRNKNNSPEYEASSSEQGAESEGEEESINDRNTGDFSQLAKPVSPKNPEGYAPQNYIFNKSKKARPQQTSDNQLPQATSLKPLTQEEPAQMTQERIANAPLIPDQNLSEIISKTIKEQVSQGIKQILQSVSQQFQTHQSQQNLHLFGSPSRNNYQSRLLETPDNRRELHSSSRGSLQSDLQEMLRIKQFSSQAGGASSSKRLHLAQHQSKATGQGFYTSALPSKQGGATGIFRDIVEEEDKIESPDMSEDSEEQEVVMGLKKESRIDIVDPSKIAVLPRHKSGIERPSEMLRLSLNQRSSNGPDLNNYQTIQERQDQQLHFSRSNSPESHNGLQNLMSSQFSQYQSKTANNQNPGVQGFYNPQGVRQQQCQGSHPLNHQWPHPHHGGWLPYQHGPTNLGPPVQPDDDSLFNFDDFLTTSQHPQHRPHSDVSTFFADNNSTIPHQYENSSSLDHVQLAIVMEDVQCVLLKGGPQPHQESEQKGTELMQLYEGDQVEVLQIIDMGPASGKGELAECRFENLVGLFPVEALKMLKRKSRGVAATGGPSLNRFQHDAYQYQVEQQARYQKQIEEQKGKLKLNERKQKKRQAMNQ